MGETNCRHTCHLGTLLSRPPQQASGATGVHMDSGLRRIAAVTGTALVLAMSGGIAPAHAAGRTITVDTVHYDHLLGDPVCTDELPADCTFSLAAQTADPGDTIVFASALAFVPLEATVEIEDDGVTIEGGGVEIVPDGDGFTGDEALGIYANHVVVRELVIHGFGDASGIEVRINKSGNTISRSPVFD